MNAQADRDPFLTMKPIPQSGATVQSFVPKGWAIESEVKGDLDGNGTLDSVVVIWDTTKKNRDEELAENEAGGENVIVEDGNRGLLILLKGMDGRYKFAGLGKNTLLCAGCYGMLGGLGGGHPDIKIKNQVISIEQFSGSRDQQDDTLRFRYDKTVNRFRLIGVDNKHTDRLTCVTDVTSINYLSNIKATSTLVCKENTEAKAIPEHKEKIEPKVWYLEDYVYYKEADN
ncbi:MAG TPA: hypothetical protein VIE65_00680 [Methylobacter sp.]